MRPSVTSLSARSPSGSFNQALLRCRALMHEVPAGFINTSSRMEERNSRVSCKLKERDFPQARRWLHWELNVWTVNVGMRQRESSLCPSCCLHNSLYLDFKTPFSPHNNVLHNPASGCFETSAMCPYTSSCLPCSSGTTGLLLPGAIHLSLSQGQ